MPLNLAHLPGGTADVHTYMEPELLVHGSCHYQARIHQKHYQIQLCNQSRIEKTF